MRISDRSSPAPLALETPVPGVRVLRVGGVLDTGNGARLLRLVDSQLLLARSGRTRLEAVIIDMSLLESLERGGPEALGHARYACERLGLSFALAGCPSSLLLSPVAVRGRLRGLTTYPTVEAAVGAGARNGSPDASDSVKASTGGLLR